jgi:hypothetical protein
MRLRLPKRKKAAEIRYNIDSERKFVDARGLVTCVL